MIGVIIPAHDEALLIEACLDSVAVATAHPSLGGEPVLIVVAADACSDETASLAAAAGARVITTAERNVGLARRAATEAAIAWGSDWIASTDADTVVAPDWLATQHALRQAGVPAVCGIVEVCDWLDHPLDVQADFAAGYVDLDGHPHVHGACLGFSTEAYLAAGGWQSLHLHEDVGLVDAIETAGYPVTRSAAVRVATSARRDPRAAGGFGDFLTTLGVSA